jgi:hypothetical protein
MHSLPIPTDEQIRAVYHANATDILNAHRRCAPQAELNALHDKQADHQMAVNLISCAKNYRHKARALNAQSDTPGLSEEQQQGLRWDAQHHYELAERDLRHAHSLLNLPTQK